MLNTRYLQMGEPDKNQIRESYNTLGGRLYDLRYESEQKLKYEIILRYVKINSADMVLDIGCGTGLFLQKLDVQCVGLDISPALVSGARLRLEWSPTKSLVLSDADFLPFRSHIFNKVFAITLIQNIADPEKSMSEMMRVAFDSATIIVTALKRAFTAEKFKEKIMKSDIQLNRLIDDESIKDWIVLASSQRERVSD